MTDVIAGRFALCDPIASGGSGVVWRAYDRKTQQFCAAKVLRRRDAGDLLRFVREQSFRLAHPHVLTPYSWAAEDTHVVIASELVDGGSLSTLLGDYGALAEGTVAVVLDQVLLALDQVHAAGLVHRDVKPGNLLLRATGAGQLHVMLADFGLAMGADDAHLTYAGTVVGTPGYLAPQQLDGTRPVDLRNDLYSAGQVALALVGGQEPTEVGRPGNLGLLRPGPLRDAIAVLITADAARRPPSARAARELLRDVPRDRIARTRAGDAIEVLHQLPPLPPDALGEASRTATQHVALGTRVGDTPPLDPTTRPIRAREPRRRRRRPLLVAGIGLVVAAAAGVPIAFALADDGTPARTRPAPTSSTRSDGVVTHFVRVGGSCDWQQEGDTATTTSKTTAVCRTRSDGAYVWTATGS